MLTNFLFIQCRESTGMSIWESCGQAVGIGSFWTVVGLMTNNDKKAQKKSSDILTRRFFPTTVDGNKSDHSFVIDQLAS